LSISAHIVRWRQKLSQYNAAWLDTQKYTHEWGERALLGVFAHLGVPDTYLDLGCGDGYLVEMAARMGILSVGVDIALERDVYFPMQILLKRDLATKLSLDQMRFSQVLTAGKGYDVVTSWEVGEHLEEAAVEIYLDTVRHHTGKWLVFTAAAVGQGGEGHINCQPQEYWWERLVARGLTYCEAETDHIKETWRWATGPCFWLPQNVQVFKC